MGASEDDLDVQHEDVKEKEIPEEKIEEIESQQDSLDSPTRLKKTKTDKIFQRHHFNQSDWQVTILNL